MSSDDRALFSNFGKSFQEKIVQALLVDRQWASQFCEVVKPEYFEYAYLQKLVDKYLAYQKKYRDFPSLQLMIDIMKDEMKLGIDAVLKDQIIDCIKRIALNKEFGDLAYVKEKSLDFCKRMELKAALTKSVGLIEENNFESIVEIIKKAIMVGSDSAPGMDLANDVEARYTQNARKTIPTGIPELDEKRILNGGLGVGEIGTIVAPTGCHIKGTKILMYDGTLKKVENIIVGDQLMGPDSNPRKVLSLVRGNETMYKVIPTKGESFIVNENHILSLKRTNFGVKSRNIKQNGKIENISIKDYLTKSKNFKHITKLYRTNEINFQQKINDNSLLIPPYILGLLIGDGSLRKEMIEHTTMDKEIKNEIKNYALSIGMGISEHYKKENKAIGLYFTSNKKHNNILRNKLEKLKLLGKTSKDKFIPFEYKVSSMENRLELLAGLIDTDGSLNNNIFDFISKSKELANDVVFICRSLGLAAYVKECKKKCQTGTIGTYYRVCISGDTYKIPCRLDRKKASIRLQKKNVLMTGFKLEQLDKDDFYGFSLDGDHLYVMDNFTITHNCGKSQLLVHIGAQALLRGKNVLHFTFELSEIVTGIRYDSHLIDISSTDCPEHKVAIDEFYKKNKETLGTLKIKFYPTATITANQLRAYIEKAKLEGFTPDLVIVDYAGIMRSSEKYDLPRFEMKKVFEELRALGHEMNVPIWTASQSNKEGISSEVVDSANMAESYSQAHVADVIIGLSRRLQDKATGICKIYVAKNRAGMDGISFTGKIDTSKSKIRILTETDVNSADVSNDAIRSTVKTSVFQAYKNSSNNSQNVKDMPLEKIQ